MLLNIEVIGNLGADAVIKDFSGVKFISFSVAHTEKIRLKDGSETEKTTWVSCLKRVGEDSRLIDYLKKGSLVYCSGAMNINMYENQHKEWNAGVNCMVQNLKLLVSKREESSEPISPVNTAQNMSDKEDLPF